MKNWIWHESTGCKLCFSVDKGKAEKLRDVKEREGDEQESIGELCLISVLSGATLMSLGLHMLYSLG